MLGYSINGVLSSSIAEQTLQELGGIPIDRMAWRVIGPGEHYERPEKLRLLCFDDAPPIIDRGKDRKHHNGKLTVDLCGKRFGRLTVIGYWGRRIKPSGGGGLATKYWVCRCLCGLFTIRRAITILTNLDRESIFTPMCDACAVDHIKKLGISEDVAFKFVKTREQLPPNERYEIMDLLKIGKIAARHDRRTT